MKSTFLYNIWGADLANMQLISKLYRGVGFLLCFIDIYSKYAWFFYFKNKIGIIITDDFPKTSKKSNWKPNKIWLDKGSKFYNRSIKSWRRSDTEMYSTQNEGKCVVAEYSLELQRIIFKKIWLQRRKICILIN